MIVLSVIQHCLSKMFYGGLKSFFVLILKNFNQKVTSIVQTPR